MDSASISTTLKPSRLKDAKLTLPVLLSLVYLGSLCVHLVIAILFINRPIALDDMYQYDMLARSLENGEGYRWYTKADMEILRPYYGRFLDIDSLDFPENGLLTTFRAPGYPFFLAGLYLLVPASLHILLARQLQAALAAALAPLVILLGRQIGLPAKANLLAALGMSLYPILLFYPIGLASENLYILLGMASITSLFFAASKKSWGRIVLSGLLLGMTMLTRSLFAVPTLLSALWIARHSPYKIKASLVVMAAAFGLCLPWSVRNSLIMGLPTFVETSAGYNLYIGAHPQSDGGFVSEIAIPPMNILDDREREEFTMGQAVNFIRQDPGEFAQRIWTRFSKFISPEDREFFYFYSNNLIGEIGQPWLAFLYALLVIPWGFTLFFGISGLWYHRANKFAQLAVLFLGGYCLPHLIIIAEPRFHLTWVPVLMPFAAGAWLSRRVIFDQFFQKKGNWLLFLILALFLIAFSGAIAANLPKLAAIMSAGGNKLNFTY